MNSTDKNRSQIGESPVPISFVEFFKSQIVSGTDQHRSAELLLKKQEKAEKIGKILFKVPGVTSVIICNNLGFGLANEDSDLDFLILTKQGQIWIARFFAMLFTKIFGYRITGGHKKDKACLSFFIAPSGYDLSKIAIEDDVYLRHWLMALKPISGFAEFERFLAINVGGFRESLISTPSWLERTLERFQRNHFNYQKKILLDCGGPPKGAPMGEVIANESMLKFHVNDRRRYYRELYNLRILDNR